MKRALAAVVAVACFVGLLRHCVRRAGRMGGFRCENCGRVFADLDDAGEEGSGYVRPARAIYTRHGASGGAEFSRNGSGDVIQ
jgi:hypothetical protein